MAVMNYTSTVHCIHKKSIFFIIIILLEFTRDTSFCPLVTRLFQAIDEREEGKDRLPFVNSAKGDQRCGKSRLRKAQ